MSGLKAAKDAFAAGDALRAHSLLRAALDRGLDYTGQTQAARLADKLSASPELAERLTPFRAAVLGSTTTAQLVPLLKLHALREGILLEVWEAPFGTWQQQILDEKSELYAFKPQAALLFVNYRDARDGDLEEEYSRWAGLWDALRSRAGCVVIANNFDLPVERPWGNLEARRPGAGIGFLRRLNAAFAERAPEGVAVLDQEHLSAVVGKERWHDDRFWIHSRQAMGFDGLARYAFEAAALLRAAAGRSLKCLVTDLDNTLWGGIVGEDGVDGLEIGGEGPGEAFAVFQRYLKDLKERGVLLAVASKNNDADAREPFAARPEMPLALEDFAAFSANWDDKASNIREITRRLNIGLDAVAFVDDNPVERDFVREALPEVRVVDLPEDPAGYRSALDRLRLFEALSVSAEDRERTGHFRAEAERERARGATPDLNAFLRGLRMEAVVRPFDAADAPRIAQLINKTNQFNLTTRRRTQAEVESLIGREGVVALSARLKDRYGDYGLVSVLIAKRRRDDLEIDTWLMSCRVLGRGLERFLFNRLVEKARAAGVKRIVGTYRPTPKNALVKGLLPELGFAPDDGAYALPVETAPTAETEVADGSKAAA